MRKQSEMPRDLTKSSSKKNNDKKNHHHRPHRTIIDDLPQDSESYSSTRANPSRSLYGLGDGGGGGDSRDTSRDGSPVPSDIATGHLTTDVSNCSLSVNYLPDKFSSGVLVGGGGGGGGGARTRTRTRRRPPTMYDSFLGVPKMGGGIEVFRSGEPRMGGEGDGDDDDEYEDEDVDEDYDHDRRRDRNEKREREGPTTAATTTTTTKKWYARGRKQNSPLHNRKLRWNKFKWILFVSNTIVSFFFSFFSFR